MSSTKRIQGMSLIEVLVVIAIIGVLIGMLIPAVMRVQESANRTMCRSNLKQIGLALTMYYDSFGKYPRVETLPSAGPSSDPILPVVLGPYIEADVNVFRCPSDQKYFFSEQSSYYYRNQDLNLKTRTEIVNKLNKELSWIWAVQDYGMVHGALGTGNAFSVLYLDGRVD